MTTETLRRPWAYPAVAGSIFKRIFSNLGSVLEQERERWIIWIPVLIGAGVALYFSLRVEPALSTGVLSCGLLGALGLGSRHRPVPARIVAALAMVAVGFLAAELRTAAVSAPILERPIGPTNVSGRVVEVEMLEKSGRIVLDQLSIAGLARARTPERVRVRLTAYSDLPKLGERVQLRAQLYGPPAPAEPDAHDFRRDMFFERIGGNGYAVRRFTEGPAVKSTPAPLLGRLRQAAAERIAVVLAGPELAPERAVALALLVGERGPIPDVIDNQMRDAGLAHLLAISGMNITIAAGLIYFALRLALAAIPWVALRYPIKKWAAAGGLLGAIAYTEFVGAPVSAERSMITTGFFMLAIVLDRTAITLRLVAVSAALLILIEPEALMGASFQMSYGAIVALVVLYERWQYRGGGIRLGEEHPFRRALTYFAGIAIMSIVASAASAVFAIYHFQQSAFYGLGANLLAVPVHDLWIMPWGIASYFLMPFGLEALALKPMGWGIHEMLWTARVFSGFPGASGHFEAMPGAALALIVSGGLWFLLWTRRWRWFGIAPVAAGIVLTLTARQPDVMIADDGKLVAIRLDSGGIALSNRQHDKFVQSVWVRRAGEGDIAANPPAALANAPEARDCAKGLCRFTVAGHEAAIVSDARMLRGGCAGAEIVVSQVAAHARCPAPLVIDPADLARDGATSITFDAAGPHVATVRETSGQRPWTAP